MTLSSLKRSPSVHDQHNARLPQYKRDFASGAMLANLTYDQPLDGTCYKLLERTGLWRGYRAKVFKDLSYGLHGYLFTRSISNDPNAIQPVKVAFRGTYDAWSVSRDLDPLGPGLLSFKFSAKTLFDQLEAAIADKPNVDLTIAGHSLGGSDAIYFLVYLLAQRQNKDRWANIRSITLNIFNAPGVNPWFATTTKNILSKNKHAKNAVPIAINVGLSDSDGIQYAWHNPFKDLDPTLATLQVVLVDKIKMMNDPLTHLGGFLYEHMQQLYEFFISHSLDKNYFSPDEYRGSINGDLYHEYWINTKKKDREHINHELSRMLPSVLSPIRKLFNIIMGEAPEADPLNVEALLADKTSPFVQSLQQRQITPDFRQHSDAYQAAVILTMARQEDVKITLSQAHDIRKQFFRAT